VARLRSPFGNFMSIAWSPDGALLAASARTSVITIWRSSDWAPYRRLDAGDGTVWNVEWAPREGVLASAGQDGRIILWEVESGVPFGVIEGHADTVARVTFCGGGGLLASLSHDETVAVWRLPDGRLVGRVAPAYPGWVSCLSFHPAQPLLAGTSRDGRSISLWRVQQASAQPEPQAPRRGDPLLYRLPALALSNELILRRRASGQVAVDVGAIEAHLQRRLPEQADLSRPVGCAARHLQAMGEVRLVDAGRRIFLQARCLPAVRAAVAAFARQLGGAGEIPFDQVPDDVLLAPLETRPGGKALQRRLVEQALVQHVTDEAAGWFQVTDGRGILFLPEAVARAMPPQLITAPRAETSWRVTGQVPASGRAVVVRLLNTTIFKRFCLFGQGALLEDGSGSRCLLRWHGGHRAAGGALLHLTVQSGEDASRTARHTALISLAEQVLRERVGSHERVADADLAAPAHAPPRQRLPWSLWDQGACGTWPLPAEDLDDDPWEAVAAMAEQAEDERLRQVRLSRLCHPDGGYDVVLCHTPQDLGRACLLRAELADAGLRAWADDDGVLAAARPARAVLELAERTRVLAVLAGAATAAPWAGHPLYPFYQALAENRPEGRPRLRWLPVVLPEAPPAPRLPDFLHSFDWFDWHDQPRGMRRGSLLRLVAAIVVDRART
jgi:hypothetical protein